MKWRKALSSVKDPAQGLRLLWLGITYPPAAGGASVYTRLIVETFDQSSKVETLQVLVEAFPGEPRQVHAPGGVARVDRVFSYRAAKATRNWLSYFKYALDNIRLLQLLAKARQLRADALVVHGWYLLHPSLLPVVLRVLRGSGVTLIADVRDNYLPRSKLHRLQPFDQILCCGKNVLAHIQQDPEFAHKAHYVPVPLPAADVPEASPVIEQLQLQPGSYLFSACGIANDKRFPLLFAAWQRLLEMGYTLDLVVAGRQRDWFEQYAQNHTNGRLVLAGTVDALALHTLYRHSAAAVNVSNNESFGRVPIEAFAYLRPMIFPSGVPEFDELPPYCITRDTAEGVADQIAKVMAEGHFRGSYDISRHQPDRVAAETIEIISQAVRHNAQ